MLWTKKPTTRETGNVTETFAAHYLVKQGLIIQDKNQHSRLGEIDIIMKDNDTFVFIEVKYRSSTLFGGAISAISSQKQQISRKENIRNIWPTLDIRARAPMQHPNV